VADPIVGQGITAAMSARQDTPATSEVYMRAPNDGPDGYSYSVAYGTSGRQYVFVPSTGRVYIYSAAA
jgi:hypothetical protein